MDNVLDIAYFILYHHVIDRIYHINGLQYDVLDAPHRPVLDVRSYAPLVAPLFTDNSSSALRTVHLHLGTTCCLLFTRHQEHRRSQKNKKYNNDNP